MSLSSHDPDAGRFDELFRLKDQIILLALQDAERYYRRRGHTEEEEAADNILDEAFDQAVLEYVREMARCATQD